MPKLDTLLENENYEAHPNNTSMCLSYFKEGNTDKPLVVFAPGAAHLSRISYGIPGSDPEDFLAYWLNKAGFSFLALSYPIENPVFKNIYPEYSLEDWAQQIEYSVHSHLCQMNSSNNNEVILILWSAAGRCVNNLVKRMEETQSFKIKSVLLLDSSPPVHFLSEPFVKFIEKKESGLCSLDSLVPFWLKWIEEQNEINNKTIISADDYKKWILGDMPIGLMSTSISYKGQSYVHDAGKASAELVFMQLKEPPFFWVIEPNSLLDLNYVVTSASNWQPFIDRSLINYVKNKYEKEGSIAWDKLLKLLKTYPKRFKTRVDRGNHFFLLGKVGAKFIADSIESFEKDLNKFEDEIKKTCLSKQGGS